MLLEVQKNERTQLPVEIGTAKSETGPTRNLAGGNEGRCREGLWPVSEERKQKLNSMLVFLRTPFFIFHGGSASISSTVVA